MKSKTISVSTLVDGRQVSHVRTLIECNGEFLVTNPHYRRIPDQSALVRLDPRHIEIVPELPERLHYSRIMLEIWSPSEA